MKQALALLLCLLMIPVCLAEMPPMSFSISDTGTRDDQGVPIVRVQIDSEAFSQTFQYASGALEADVNPFELADMNFDGHDDLVLVVGMGGYNEYVIVCPWQPEEGRFAEPAREAVLCNYQLRPESEDILSTARDGALYYELSRYAWTDGNLALKARCESFPGLKDGEIGERAALYADDGTETLLWEDVYSDEWYAGERVAAERYEVLYATAFNDLTAAAKRASVTGASRVNLRQQDGTDSAIVTTIARNETVVVLAEGAGADGDWTRVLYDGKTGYVSAKYLQFAQ